MDVVVTDNSADDIIVFMNEDGGQHWAENVVDNNFDKPNPVFAYDIDLDNDLDILPTSQVDNALIWYENHLGAAYAQTWEVSPFLIKAPSDTLTVRTNVSNPENHPANVFAVIQGEQFQFIDTLQLFDDGLHSDSDSSDNVWGNIKLSPELPEDGYKVDLITYDSIDDVTLGFAQAARFITFGPVEFEEYTFYPAFVPNDTVPNPGDMLNLKLTLKNSSSMATASDIEAVLISLDTLVNFTYFRSSFEDIPAGKSSISNNYLLSFSKECPIDREVPIEVNISSYGTVCWRDTFSITVVDPNVNVEAVRASMIRIYPNPTNNLLTIETNKPDHYSIEITSLNGQMMYSEIKEGTSHQIDLSTFQSGVYFITIRSKNIVVTKKLIKLK